MPLKTCWQNQNARVSGWDLLGKCSERLGVYTQFHHQNVSYWVMFSKISVLIRFHCYSVLQTWLCQSNQCLIKNLNHIKIHHVTVMITLCVTAKSVFHFSYLSCTTESAWSTAGNVYHVFPREMFTTCFKTGTMWGQLSTIIHRLSIGQTTLYTGRVCDIYEIDTHEIDNETYLAVNSLWWLVTSSFPAQSLQLAFLVTPMLQGSGTILVRLYKDAGKMLFGYRHYDHRKCPTSFAP